jgi:DNA-binding MarR family transcriptional regulator
MQRLVVTRATVTGLLDSLERRGFVRRSANPTDRRSLLVEITPAGLEVIQEVRTTVHRHEKAWLGGFSDQELRSYIEQLHRIQDSLPSASTNDRIQDSLPSASTNEG